MPPRRGEVRRRASADKNVCVTIRTAMEFALPADLKERVEQELAKGGFRSSNDLIEHAVRRFLDESQRGQSRLDALRRIGHAVDKAGLYERVLIPDEN
jgi:Arc/MetJ-type ribon-helix-helix transcriptional regulator